MKFTAEGRITIGYRLKDFATLEVFVEDTGTGMSEEVLAHIFERFYKGDAFVQGTGLGLAICRTIVEKVSWKNRKWLQLLARGAALQLSFRRKCGSSVLFLGYLM